MKIFIKLHLFSYVKAVQNIAAILLMLFTLCSNYIEYPVPCYYEIMKEP
jgi:hypothetical protein